MFRGRNGSEVATKTILVRLFLIQHPHADKEGQNSWLVGWSGPHAEDMPLGRGDRVVCVSGWSLFVAAQN